MSIVFTDKININPDELVIPVNSKSWIRTIKLGSAVGKVSLWVGPYMLSEKTPDKTSAIIFENVSIPAFTLNGNNINIKVKFTTAFDKFNNNMDIEIREDKVSPDDINSIFYITYENKLYFYGPNGMSMVEKEDLVSDYNVLFIKKGYNVLKYKPSLAASESIQYLDNIIKSVKAQTKEKEKEKIEIEELPDKK